MPEQLEVASINGVEVAAAQGMWNKGDKRLELLPGRYQMLVFYRESWDSGSDQDVLRSDPALFTIDAQAAHQYRIDYERPSRYDDARKLSRDFKAWWVDQASGVKTASTDSGLKFDDGLRALMTGNHELVPDSGGKDADVQRVLPLSAPTAGSAPASAAPATMPAAPSATASAASQLAHVEDTSPPRDWVALMKAWWQQASIEERREFLRWVGEQP
ncbi:MAG TPA: DUF2057 family protein [Solimonas sp.]